MFTLISMNQIGRIKREALKELTAIMKWRNQHAGTVHRNSYAERSKVRPDANVSQAVLPGAAPASDLIAH
ncbi:hypothetical protein TNCV_4208261 [Trichonephila clavipes]|nr:hypothetical protein TNCV_4208261 [Trichonephila clavipes]